MKEILLTQVLPPLLDMAVVTVIAAFCTLFSRWTGIQIDAKHKDALQSALSNGAKLLLLPGGSLDDAIDYVSRSVPDALKRFDLNTRDDIQTFLEPHILTLQAATGRDLVPSNRIRADPK
jgi:hypothetical protein